MSVETTNLHKVDGDSRKMVAVRNLVQRFPEAIGYWQNSGALERAPVFVEKDGEKVDRGTTKHKHGVLGHQFGGAIFSEQIVAMLQERGLLNYDQGRETVLATLIHDADKPTDMAFIVMAMGGRDGQGEVSWFKVEEIVRGTDLANKVQVLDELRRYSQFFDKTVDVGDRVHVARALIAGRVHKERLKAAGFSDRVIEIQGATEYTGWEEVDYLIDDFPNLTGETRALALQKIVINYIDNGMMESELVEPDVRTAAVFKKPINIALSTAWANYNEKGETAEAKQIRVGFKVRAFLAELVGVNPDEFLGVLESRVQTRFSSV